MSKEELERMIKEELERREKLLNEAVEELLEEGVADISELLLLEGIEHRNAVATILRDEFDVMRIQVEVQGIWKESLVEMCTPDEEVEDEAERDRMIGECIDEELKQLFEEYAGFKRELKLSYAEMKVTAYSDIYGDDAAESVFDVLEFEFNNRTADRIKKGGVEELKEVLRRAIIIYKQLLDLEATLQAIAL